MSTRESTGGSDGNSPLQRLQTIEALVALVAAALTVLSTIVLATAGITPLLSLSIAAVAFAAAGHAGVFKVAISMEDWQTLTTVAIASLAGLASVAIFETLLTTSIHSFTAYIIATIATAAALGGGVILGRQLVRALWRAGQLRTTAVVVGNEYTNHELTLEISEHRSLGIDVIGAVSLGDDAWSTSHRLAQTVADLDPDRVIIAGSSATTDFELASTISSSRARSYLLPELFTTTSGQAWFAPHQLNGFPLLRVDRKARQARDGVMSAGANPIRQF